MSYVKAAEVDVEEVGVLNTKALPAGGGQGSVWTSATAVRTGLIAMVRSVWAALNPTV